MNDTGTIIERGVANWHEPDPDQRRATIDELCAADCVYRNGRAEFTGRDGVQEAVTAAHEVWDKQRYAVGVGGVGGPPGADPPPAGTRYVWELAPAEGGEPASVGTHFALVDPEGRLISDHQFVDVA